jgi:hypothetical protein
MSNTTHQALIRQTVQAFCHESLDLEPSEADQLVTSLTNRLVVALSSVAAAPAAKPRARRSKATAAAAGEEGSEGSKRSNKPNWYATFGKAVTGKADSMGPLAEVTEFTFNLDVNIEAPATRALLEQIRTDEEAMKTFSGAKFDSLKSCRDAVIEYFKAKQAAGGAAIRQMTVTSLIRNCCVTEEMLNAYKAWFAANQAAAGAATAEAEAEAETPAAAMAPVAHVAAPVAVTHVAPVVHAPPVTTTKPVVINRGAAPTPMAPVAAKKIGAK